MPRLKLSSIVNGMESMGDETRTFLDRQSGEVVFLMDDEIRRAEDGDDSPGEYDREPEDAKLAEAVVADDGTRFLPLPSEFDINAWKMMRDFATGLEDQALGEALLTAIHGRGAFRCFKDRIYEADIAEKWYKFRDSAYRQIALDWCRDHDIEVDAEA